MPASFATRTTVTQPWTPSTAPATIHVPSAQLAQRLGRTLLLVPHFDDECATGALLQKLPEAAVLFLTDGAPRDAYFWRRYGTREQYSALRRQESLEALHSEGIRNTFTIDNIPDQELFRALPQAFATACEIAQNFRPATILAPAFEGGHPDHDSAAFLAAQLARKTGAQHWEVPYYHRKPSGEVAQQEFRDHYASSVEITLSLTDVEIQRKRAMWSRYQSQCAVLQEFAVEKEIYRQAPAYRWHRPPHAGVLNYEAWRWNVRGEDLASAFSAALEAMA